MHLPSIPILEVAISIVISWALFAIFCSMIHETIIQIKCERGRFFKKQLLNQLYDAPNEINWGSLLYTHPSIDLLSRAYNKPSSSISAKIFSEAIIEVVGGAHMVQSKKDEQIDLHARYGHPQLTDFSFAVNTLLPSDVVSLLKSALIKADIKAGENKSAVYNLLIDEISNWYGELCQRTSIWYLKRTKLRLFGLGLLISVLLNIDSIQLFKFYNSHPQARASLITYFEENSIFLKELIPSDSLIGNTRTENASVINNIQRYQQQIDSLTKLNKIPIGSCIFEKSEIKECKYNQKKPDWFFLKIVGFIISAFAVSVGAPFWFEVLKKATIIKK